MKKCLPLCVSELSIAREAVKKYSDKFDAFELWLDYLMPLHLEEVSKFVDSSSEEFLLLFRRKDLEASRTPASVRHEFIDTFQNERVSWDIDIGTQEEELAFYRGKERTSKLVCSYHQYESTPALSELRSVKEGMLKYDPQVLKFACFVNEPRDLMCLLELLAELREEGRQAVVLGMGEQGMVTRIFGEQFGNAYTFLTCSDDSLVGPTASGQLTIEDFNDLQRMVERVTNGGK